MASAPRPEVPTGLPSAAKFLFIIVQRSAARRPHGHDAGVSPPGQAHARTGCPVIPKAKGSKGLFRRCSTVTVPARVGGVAPPGTASDVMTRGERTATMRIGLVSIYVDDQDQAER